MQIKNLFSVLLLVFFSGLNAQDWIQQSIDLTINTKFSIAESLLVNQINIDESSMPAHFYYASVLISKMTHFENRREEEKFLNAIHQVIAKGESDLLGKAITQSEKARILFYLGSAYGYLAFYQDRTGDWFSALKNGKSAHSYLLEVVKTDSTMWDAYLGLGSYKYWLSSKIHWIPFMEDEREEGIRFIFKAIDKKTAGKPIAMHQLIYILLDYGDFELAEKLAYKIIAEYPQSQFMYWAYSHVFMKKRNFEKAISAYQSLLGLIESDPNANPNHKITCLARMMDMYSRSGNCIEANLINQQIVKNNYYSQIRNNEEVERLLDEVNDSCGGSE